MSELAAVGKEMVRADLVRKFYKMRENSSTFALVMMKKSVIIKI